VGEDGDQDAIHGGLVLKGAHHGAGAAADLAEAALRRRGGRKRALATRAPMTSPQAPNQLGSLHFASDVLSDGRRLRVLVVVDDFSRECLAPVVAR